MARYAATIFLSAFLLFQVQPLFGKFILPWFGGTPGVWTACMLFFQVVLLAGYSYAHFSISRLSPRTQVTVHLVLLGVALLFLPAIPSPEWKPTGTEAPTWRILAVLASTIGLPYLMLSSTAPLLQAWFSRELPGRSPYRLYALSNFGSLLGLLSYPFMVEPNLTLRWQGYGWSLLFVAYVVLCGWSAWRMRSVETGELKLSGPAESQAPVAPPSIGDRALWLGLAACGSVMLLATTNQMTQDVAAVPFLWVLPLCLYLLSFIITFDSPRWYFRPMWAVLMPISVAWAFYAMAEGVELEIQWQVVIYCAALLACCMVLHGEMVRIKPAPRYLTGFYLMISLGGAAGGAFVSLIAPALFNGYWEFPGALIASCVLYMLAVYRQAPASMRVPKVAFYGAVIALAAAGVWLGLRVAQRPTANETLMWQCTALIAVAGAIFLIMQFQRASGFHTQIGRIIAVCGAIVAGLAGYLAASVYLDVKADAARAVAVTRNFYGVLRVDEEPAYDGYSTYRSLMHGRIQHGIQMLEGDLQYAPTSYYAPYSGIGVAVETLRELRQKPAGPGALRIGVLGLGTASMAAHGQSGDYILFYEINDEVVRLSDTYFTYRQHTPAKTDIALGDARITMEREQAAGTSQQFDILAMDAFTGDAVPLHLLTREALQTYFHHLKPDGVLAVHISNRYLDLSPLMHDLAEDAGKQAVIIDNDEDPEYAIDASTWVLITSNQAFLNSDRVQEHAGDWPARHPRKLVFTDDFSNLFHVLARDYEEGTVEQASEADAAAETSSE